MTGVLQGLFGVLACAALAPMVMPVSRAIDATRLAQITGGTQCQMANLSSSECNDCVSDGNGGWVKCDTNPQGHKCGSYTNPEEHEGPNCEVDWSSCDGVAYGYQTYPCLGTYYYTNPCGRQYRSDYETSGLPVRCP